MKKGASKKPLIGFIGQGYVGKNYADDFVRRGYPVVRYSLEEPHVNNKEEIRNCDIVFIAVPTPTTQRGFNRSVVEKAIALVGDQKIAVIKSTIVPGSTKALQKRYSRKFVLYSPEFLSEATAAKDVRKPFSSIVGIPKHTPVFKKAAATVLRLLPKAPFELACDSTEAELIKYAHNGSGYVQVVFFNLMYDLANKLGVSWEPIRKAIEADAYVCNRYARPIHKTGRGAGGSCFIKDFAALRGAYEAHVAHPLGSRAFRSFEQKNLYYLRSTGKDLHLVEGVYGRGALKER